MPWNTGFERVSHDVKGWQLKHSRSVLYPLTDPRDPRSQRGPNSFIFMQFLAKYLQNDRTLGVGAPPQENPGSATGTDISALVYLPIASLHMFCLPKVAGELEE